VETGREPGPEDPASVRARRPGGRGGAHRRAGDRHAGAWWATGSIALYCLVAVVAMWNVWTSHPTTVTVAGGDAYMDSWFLGFMAEALAHGHNPLFTVYGNYPYGINILDNSSQPLLGVLATPITLVWGSIAAFNVMVTAGMAASATTAYFLVRRFASWQPAALLGGLLYGFSPYSILQSSDGHLNISFVAVPPLIFLVLHDTLVARRERWVRNGLLLTLLVVVQFFISDEVLFTTVVIAVVVVVAAAVAAHRTLRERLAEAGKSLVLTVGCGVALLAYPTWYAERGPGSIVGPIQPVAQAYRTDLLGAVVPNTLERLAPSGHLLAIAEKFSNSVGENSAYIGIPLVVLLVVTVVWLRRDARVVVVAVAGLAAFVLSLGGALALYKAPALTATGGAAGRLPLPEALLSKIGPLRNIIPVRISLYVFLAAAVLLGIVLTRLHESWTDRWGGVAGIAGPLLVAGVALAPLVPVIPFEAVAPIGQPAYFDSAVHSEIPAGSVALLYPYPSSLVPAAEAWDAYADLPFEMPGGYFLVPQADGTIEDAGVAGYTRTTPVTRWLTALYKGTPYPETAARRAALRGQLASDHVQSVVAVPAYGADPTSALAHLTWLLGPPTADQGGTVDWYHLHWNP
jgi:hypothetical protein